MHPGHKAHSNAVDLTTTLQRLSLILHPSRCGTTAPPKEEEDFTTETVESEETALLADFIKVLLDSASPPAFIQQELSQVLDNEWQLQQVMALLGLPYQDPSSAQYQSTPGDTNPPPSASSNPSGMRSDMMATNDPVTLRRPIPQTSRLLEKALSASAAPISVPRPVQAPGSSVRTSDTMDDHVTSTKHQVKSIAAKSNPVQVDRHSSDVRSRLGGWVGSSSSTSYENERSGRGDVRNRGDGRSGILSRLGARVTPYPAVDRSNAKKVDHLLDRDSSWKRSRSPFESQARGIVQDASNSTWIKNLPQDDAQYSLSSGSASDLRQDVKEQRKLERALRSKLLKSKIPCKFGINCLLGDQCEFSHAVVAGKDAGSQAPFICPYGVNCLNPLCQGTHPSPAMLTVIPGSRGTVVSVASATLNPNVAEFVPSPTTPVIWCRFDSFCTNLHCPYPHRNAPVRAEKSKKFTSTMQQQHGAALGKSRNKVWVNNATSMTMDVETENNASASVMEKSDLSGNLNPEMEIDTPARVAPRSQRPFAATDSSPFRALD